MGITFKEIGDDCDLCPLHKQNMCHGLVNNGNGPVYPPCSELDEDTDADAYMESILKRQHERIQRERERAEKKRLQEHKKEVQRKRSQYSNMYCRAELEQVNKLNRLMKDLEKELSVIESYISVADIMEKVDGHAPDAEKFISHRKQIKAHIAETEKKQCEAKERLTMKRKECRLSEKYQSIS